MDWMNKAEYKDWLEPDPVDNTNAWCRIYVKTFTLSNMGEPAVKSHAQGKKHQSTIQGSRTSSSIKQFFTVKDTATASTSSKSGEELPSMTPSSGEQKGQKQQFVSRKDQHIAEIRWALKTVMSHYSLNSAQDITDVFHAMFPDSNIAKRMSCGATKLSYLITFGIAPFFKQELLIDVSQAPYFVISFDESLNPDLHEEQMDFIVRFIKDGKVEMRYLGSVFLGYTTAADLKRNFDEATKDLDKRKMIQVSMDGPNVNWKLLSSIVDE